MTNKKSDKPEEEQEVSDKFTKFLLRKFQYFSEYFIRATSKFFQYWLILNAHNMRTNLSIRSLSLRWFKSTNGTDLRWSTPSTMHSNLHSSNVPTVARASPLSTDVSSFAHWLLAWLYLRSAMITFTHSQHRGEICAVLRVLKLCWF